MSPIPWFRRLYIRWLLWQRRDPTSPTLYDKYGYPYWLDQCKGDHISIWKLTGTCKRDNPIAEVKLSWFEPNVLTLDDIHITKKQYRRCNLGSQLIDRIKQFALSENLTTITGQIGVNDYKDNCKLPIWYERQGFTVNFYDQPQNGFVADILFVIPTATTNL